MLDILTNIFVKIMISTAQKNVKIVKNKCSIYPVANAHHDMTVPYIQYVYIYTILMDVLQVLLIYK